VVTSLSAVIEPGHGSKPQQDEKAKERTASAKSWNVVFIMCPDSSKLSGQRNKKALKFMGTSTTNNKI
jgi:hypothetical protein